MKNIASKLLLIFVFLCNSKIVSQAQGTTTIRGPISAIRIDGDRLLIGQGSTLIEGKISDQGVDVIRTTDLQRHDIRAITTTQGITLALSEDGITTLDRSGKVIDFVRGSGQRIAVSGGRVYIAALQAGVRVLSIDSAGKLSALGGFATLGAARDIAPEISGLVWVAEEDQGVRLYDAQTVATVKPITWVKSLAPATAVRISGTHLIVGHANTISILDTFNATAPRILGRVTLDKAEINDLAIAGTKVYVGHKGSAGADITMIDITDFKAPTISGTFGNNGAGEALALYPKTNDLFIGSGRQGLRRTHLSGNQAVLVATWEPIEAAQPCQLSAPTPLQPASGDEVPHDTVTLQWAAVCHATSYEVRVNGQVIGTTKDTSFSFTPTKAHLAWEVTAVDSAGKRAEGLQWSFDLAVEGWLATPAGLPNAKLLYSPPVVLLDLRSPGQVLLATCAALLVGVTVIVIGAWGIGAWAEQRRLKRL